MKETKTYIIKASYCNAIYQVEGYWEDGALFGKYRVLRSFGKNTLDGNESEWVDGTGKFTDPALLFEI